MDTVSTHLSVYILYESICESSSLRFCTKKEKELIISGVTKGLEKDAKDFVFVFLQRLNALLRTIFPPTHAHPYLARSRKNTNLDLGGDGSCGDFNQADL